MCPRSQPCGLKNVKHERRTHVMVNGGERSGLIKYDLPVQGNFQCHLRACGRQMNVETKNERKCEQATVNHSYQYYKFKLTGSPL